MSEQQPPDAESPFTDRTPQSTVPPSPHPIRLAVFDDLKRSRLTVFFRLLLAIPISFGGTCRAR